MFAGTVPESAGEGNHSPPAPQGPNARNPRTCVTCKRRKVRCDRQTPCANCIKAQIQCKYPPPGRAPRQGKPRIKKLQEKGNLPDIVDQVWSLMTQVIEQSMHPDMAALKQSAMGESSSQSQPRGRSSKSTGVRVVGMDEATSSVRSDPILGDIPFGSDSSQGQSPSSHPAGQLVLEEGKSQYIPSPFWASMSETIKDEIQEILEEHDDSGDETPFIPADIPLESNHHSFIMGYTSTAADLEKLHPPRAQVPFYWQTFQANVNPVTKLVHVPTMDKVIAEVQKNHDSLSASTEALIFAIYYATIVSMPADEVNTNMNADKDYLLRRYRFAVEQALARAKFLDTSEIVTLQAFVLFLTSVRASDDSRFVWTLTGLAIRLAQALGLHRDGTKFGLSPFNTEMRRRIWWQLCISDVRASDDHGFELSIGDKSFDTEFPLSINDEDIHPESTEAPVPVPCLTDMTSCLMRIEICNLHRKLFYTSPGKSALPANPQPLTFEEREAIVKETSDYMEKQYFQYCAHAGPNYRSAAIIARLVLSRISLSIYQPLTHPARPSTLPQSTRDRLFIVSIEIIEYLGALQSDPNLKGFTWLFQTFPQWHGIAFILTELAVRPPSPLVDRAWGVVLIFRDSTIVNSSSRTGTLWRPLRVLLGRAIRKREENKRLYPPGHLPPNIDDHQYVDGQYAPPPPLEMQANPNFIPSSSAASPDFPVPSATYVQAPGMYMPPQYSGIEPPFTHPDMFLQEDQIAQMQYQPPFFVDDVAMQDLSMSNMYMSDMGEENWDNWDQLVPGYNIGPTRYWS